MPAEDQQQCSLCSPGKAAAQGTTTCSDCHEGRAAALSGSRQLLLFLLLLLLLLFLLLLLLFMLLLLLLLLLCASLEHLGNMLIVRGVSNAKHAKLELLHLLRGAAFARPALLDVEPS
ncbi:unnamed protein product [Polarella glacialis]|uniref:Uncharacterized protein n=1 Tax=Polarella glacialis TaxID=89957 RepID=A0A813KHN2_POLGL|nr:unnamed protein product [Polarella glacialis]CAE8712840.1 unnamed protein product [Polarella glacialis]